MAARNSLNSFTERMVKNWNRLCWEAVESPTLEVLKKCVDVLIRGTVYRWTQQS